MALRAPFVVGGREAYVNASIGIATGVPRDAEPGDLLRQADTALYRAKAAGRGTYAVFEPAMRAPVVERLERETALRRAVERGELRLHYQPLVDLATGSIVGVEALVRWAHPEHGLITPAGFIRLAEETGLIVPLGRWALHEACRRARSWGNVEGGVSPAVSVNLSSRQFQEAGLADEVATVLEETGLDPEYLELEITETVAMAYGTETRRTLDALKSLGVRLAIDDFGSGYSSLGHLRELAVDGLKLDRAFVSGLGHDPGSLAIARAVATLAHDLGLRVTAEGIEEAEQAALLQALGVERGQGYYFARPLADGAIDTLLTRNPRLPENVEAVPSAYNRMAAPISSDEDGSAAPVVGGRSRQGRSG